MRILLTYEKPETELLTLSFEANFCKSGEVETTTIVVDPWSLEEEEETW